MAAKYIVILKLQKLTSQGEQMDRSDFEKLKQSLETAGQLPIRIVSDSMEPLLRVQETLDVKKLENSLKTFDLVVFYQARRLNCHFFWRDQKDFDNCIVTRSLKEPAQDDPPVPYDCILGWIPERRIRFSMKLKILFQISAAGF
jgi:hypothetical protein